MSPFELSVVLPKLRALNEQHGVIHAKTLASVMQKSERRVRQYLNALEKNDLVARPDGPRSGWIALDFQLQGV